MKLILDISWQWLKQLATNFRLWLALTMLAVPLGILAQLQGIRAAYLNPDFAGLTSSSPIQSISLNVDGRPQALEFYLADVLESQWPVKAVYEETGNLLLSEAGRQTQVQVSFFSGGFQQLGLQPTLGEFTAMDFPLPGAELVAAISYSFWQRHFQGRKNIIGQPLVLSDKAVTIVAVMPRDFKAFRPHLQMDLVLPFNQQQQLRLIKEGSVAPATLSYLIGEQQALSMVATSASQYLQEQAYLMENAGISLSPALGVDRATYKAVTQRIQGLTWLFILLLLFCLGAFVAFQAGESSRKQQELQVRRFCGASGTQVSLQLTVELVLLLLLLLGLFALSLWPLGELVRVFLPQVNVAQIQSTAVLMSSWLGGVVLFFIGGLFVLLWLQQKWLKSHTGRGQSQGLGQKLQAYFLLSVLISLSSQVMYFSVNLLLQQWQLYQKPLGFSTEGRYLVSFDLPQRGRTHFANDNARLLVGELENQPGIEAAAITQIPPFKDISTYTGWVTPEHNPVGVGASGDTLTAIITPGLFELFDTPLILGHDLVWENKWQVLVNRTLWEQALSQYSLAEAKLLQKFDDGYHAFQVVGVVEDIHLRGPDSQRQPMVFQPTWTLVGWESLVIRSKLDAANLKLLVEQVINKIDVTLTGTKVESLAELARQENAPRLAILAICLCSALVTLLAAAVFTLNSSAQMAQKGARELALRSCLGARQGQLIGKELGYFLLMFMPVFLLCLFLMNYVRRLMEEHIINILQPQMLLLATGLFLLFSCLSAGWHIRQQLRNKWVYLG